MSQSPAHILIVEDEPKLAALLADYLHASGYRTRILSDGLAVVPAVRRDPPDLILLDLLLPGQDGLDCCRELRAFSHVPIIMMTARVEEVDRLLGLELGADDYVCKPFHPRELVARVRAQLRRVAWLRQPEPEPVAGLQLDEERFEARLHGHQLELTPVEFRLLQTLSAQPGRVYSRAALMAQVYSDHRIVTDRTMDTHVKNLRRKLKATAPTADCIRSVYGLGYKLDWPPPESSP